MQYLPSTSLAIETSCDETGFAYFVIEDKTVKLVGHSLYSQALDHAQFGGVMPNLASRLHYKKIPSVFSDLVSQVRSSGLQFAPEVIFVTDGPGLSPSLWAGVNQAEILGNALGIPVYGVNHMHGHLFSGFFEHKNQSFLLNKEIHNSLGVLISGGHTDFLKVNDWGVYEWIGGTKDDAIGEAFDKVAKMLGLGYPGGAIVSMKANAGSSDAFDFPLPMLHSKDLMMSYSGLKTAVLYNIQAYQQTHSVLDETFVANICSSFQKAAIDVLIQKINHGINTYQPQQMLIGGGVMANPYLQQELEHVSKKYHLRIISAQGGLTSDNAIMIGMAGLYHLYHQVPLLPPKVDASLRSDSI
jgi:N6-L-threonylcarbamoyladenine synthase